MEDLKIINRLFSEEISERYLSYALSTITSRSLPDVRDGLKPVHRRLIYAMRQLKLNPNSNFKKSARVVGDVMGKFHPHGDAAIYDAMVRMAQEFSLKYPLVDGQGNFGNIDGDNAAAMRYTEAKLTEFAELLIKDIDSNTVDFKETYDGEDNEPVVLPSAIPNLLANGSHGIAVGMATSIPPHNLSEVIDGCVTILRNPDTSEDELNEIIPGPDFPTGGLIIGRNGIKSAQLTGRGSVILRGKATIEDNNNKNSIIITEIPYQVNKSNLIEKIAELVRDKRIEGISDIRDVSDRHGIRVIVELKKDAEAEVILNQLYKFTPLQSSFGCNMVTLNAGKPELLSLRQIIDAFLDFRVEIVIKRTTFLLNKSRDRAHVLVGLAIAIANIDEIIKVIRSSPDPATARDYMLKKKWIPKNVESLIQLIDDPRHKIAEDGTYMLSIEQVQAILDLRLQRLTAIGRDEIEKELNAIGDDIKKYLEILTNRNVLDNLIEEELLEAKTSFGVPRKTEITDVELDVDDEDLIPKQDVVVTVSHKGYIKRVPLATYRSQRRGGKGRSGMSTRDEDFVTQIFVENTHTPILFFSSTGIVYKMKVWKLPQGTPQSKGKAMINLLPLSEGEVITTIMPLPENEMEWENLNIVFTTMNGNVRKNKLSDFVDVRANGKIAMKLQNNDEIKTVETCTDEDDILITTSKGQCIRFKVTDIRLFVGRSSTGVRGIRLGKDDKVISSTIIKSMDASTEERAAYIKMSRAVRGETDHDNVQDEISDNVTPAVLSDEKYAEMGASEQFILSISENGFGKRTSAFEYRVTGRGGKGIIAMVVNERNGNLADSFPVETSNQIILVTNKGKLIRCPVDDIRIASRSTQGVKIFDIDEDEQVVSVERLGDLETENDEVENE